MFFFMTTNKKRQCYPLYFIWQRQQCYPLCFFSWRPIKNKCYPLWFLSWRPIKNSYPLCFFSWRPIKNNSVTPYILFDKDSSVTLYAIDSAIDMIALWLKWKTLCFPQKLRYGFQWFRQKALHCTTEAMTIHNNQSSIKRIYMTLKCMCVFLLFPLRFFHEDQ